MKKVFDILDNVLAASQNVIEQAQRINNAANRWAILGVVPNLSNTVLPPPTPIFFTIKMPKGTRAS